MMPLKIIKSRSLKLKISHYLKGMACIYSFEAMPSHCDWTLKFSPGNVILLCLVSHTSNIISLTTTNYTQQEDWS